MLLYNSFGPNPRGTRMFLAEKGIALPPTKELDVMKGDTRTPEYLKLNPSGHTPMLQLDNGKYISETVAIWEYFEELHPNPPLVGVTPDERAETRMWQRRIELNITENFGNSFRFGEAYEIYKNRIPCAPEAVQGLRHVVTERLKWLDSLIAGRDFIVPNRFTYADIHLFSIFDFAASAGLGFDPSLNNLGAWFKRIAARPSATASLYPTWQTLKLRG